MARKKRVKKGKPETVAADGQAERDLQKHLRSLGLQTVAQYKDWCREYGFSRSTKKSQERRRREYAIVRRQTADARLAQGGRRARKLSRLITEALQGVSFPEDSLPQNLKSLPRVLKSLAKDAQTRRTFQDLVQHAESCTDLLDRATPFPELGDRYGNSYLEAIAALVRCSRNWRRSFTTWKPRTHNTKRQFSELARHLLAEYDVPAFMDIVWFGGISGESNEHQSWFRHIAQGRSIRTAGLPIPYTKRMAHHFMAAPADCTVNNALRWGQIFGMGGDARLAEAIRGTRLADCLEHDDFWITVLQFFIAHPLLDMAHVGPIIDYLDDRRHQSHEVFVARGLLQRRPPEQPNLSMKGRTPESLLQQVERWHRAVGENTRHNRQWVSSGIGNFRFIEGSQESKNMRKWTITELLSSSELQEEGRSMHHCVSSYAGSCASGATSIWSLAVETHIGRQRVLTIEVRRKAKQIFQARGKFNTMPGDNAQKIMRRWAAIEGMTIARHV